MTNTRDKNQSVAENLYKCLKSGEVMVPSTHQSCGENPAGWTKQKVNGSFNTGKTLASERLKGYCS